MICLPIFDLPTRSSSGFLGRYILPRMIPNFIVGPMARNPLFGLLAPSSDIIIGTGHSSPDEYTGQNESPIWKIGNYNPQQVQGKVVKLLSCQAGAELGPDLVQNGALCFAGYDQDFLWIADPQDYFFPWDDEDAAVSLMPVIAGLNVLLDGGTCGEAFAVEKAGFLTNAANTDFELQRALLEYNHDHAVLFGDPNATINPRPKIHLPWPPPPLLLP